MGGYYRPRWALLLDAMSASEQAGLPLNLSAVAAATGTFEAAWVADTPERPPVVASGADPVALAAASLDAFASWRPGDWTALPDTDIGPAPRGHSFVQVGPNGSAAVGPDCPFIEQVNGLDLAACQASCLGDALCSGLNYDAQAGFCVHRQCTDPLAPQLSPLPGWVYWGIDSPPSPLIHAAWHRDPGVLASLCAADPGCRGFSSGGALYANVTGVVAAPGVTLYVGVAARDV